MHNPLPSWNNSVAKHRILDFVRRVTEVGGRGYVPLEDRVAVFDNDGTLWCEKPIPAQVDFLLRKIAENGRRDPELRHLQPWKAAIEKDYSWLEQAMTKHAWGDNADFEVLERGLLTAYRGLTIDEYQHEVLQFFGTALHPELNCRYLECTYEPMIELIDLLEEAGFCNFIASGSSRDFIRLVTMDLYHVPAEQVIGSTIDFRYRNGHKCADLVHEPDAVFYDNGSCKASVIWTRIGKRPIFVMGNSDDDVEMLRFCNHPSRPSLSLLLHHDDAKREFAYNAGSSRALSEASIYDWAVVSMKEDWRTVFSERSLQMTAIEDRGR